MIKGKILNNQTISGEIKDNSRSFEGTVTQGGPPGPPGKQGEPGIGVDRFKLYETGDIEVYYTDDTYQELGNIKGPQGDKGEPGEQGETGVSGVYVGSEEPTNPDVNVWVDTDGEWDIPPIPTSTSELINDSGFITLEDIPTPEIPTKTSDLINDSEFITLNDIPEIPDRLSELTNDTGYITSDSLPTNVSELTNDAGYLTEHQSLSEYVKTNDSRLSDSREPKPHTHSQYLDKNSTGINTLAGKVQVGNNSTNITNAFTHIRNVGSSNITGKNVNGAAFSVNGDGTASFQHKLYDDNGGNAKNAAVLRFYGKPDGTGKMQFAVNTSTAATPTEAMFKDVALTSDIPTNISELTNDSGFITVDGVPEEIFIAKYGSTSYEDIDAAYKAGKLIFMDYSHHLINLNAIGGDYYEFCGIYTQSNTINCYCYKRTPNSVWTVGTWAASKSDHTHSQYITADAIPTDISYFTNDVGYLTEHQSLADYATKDYVENEIATFDFIKIVDELPETGLPNRTYLLAKGTSEDNDLYDEYLWVDGNWELLGNKKIEVDLTNYALKSELPTKTSQLQNDSNFLTQHQSLAGKADKIHTHSSDQIGEKIELAFTTKENVYINSANGAEVGYTGWSDTNYIAVEGGREYIAYWTVSSSWNAWYDADKAYISGVSINSGISTIKVPENAAYLRVSNSTAAVNSFEISYIEPLQLPEKVSDLTNDIGYITNAALTNYVKTDDSRLKGNLIQVTYNVTTRDEIQAILDRGDMPFLIYSGGTYWYQDISYDNYYRFVSFTPGSSNTSDPPVIKRIYKSKNANEGGWGNGTITLFSTTHKPSWDNVTGKPTEFTPASHTHDQYALSTDIPTDEHINSLIQAAFDNLDLGGLADEY